MRYLTLTLLLIGFAVTGCKKDDDAATPVAANDAGGSGLSANSTPQFSIVHPVTGVVRTALASSPGMIQNGEIVWDGVGPNNSSYHRGTADLFNYSSGNSTPERVTVVFGWKTYSSDTGLSLSDWLAGFLSVGSLPLATEEHIFVDDPIMRARVLYQDLQGDVFMSITGDNANASFEVEDVKFMPAAGTLPSRIRFYVTFNCETDAGPLQGHVVSSLAID